LIEPFLTFFRGIVGGIDTYVIPDGPKPWTWTTVSSFDQAKGAGVLAARD